MKQEERQILLETAIAQIEHSTHYEGCYKYHPWCAVIELIDEPKFKVGDLVNSIYHNWPIPHEVLGINYYKIKFCWPDGDSYEVYFPESQLVSWEAENKCNHRGFAHFTDSYFEHLFSSGQFVYCPKCGEKL